MGNNTTYSHFYKPLLGASGAAELALFDAKLDRLDAFFQVDCKNYDHPDDAITAIGSDNKTLIVTETETCDTNFTVPANVMVKFERGGKWTINTGITVTFNGQIEAGLYQVFDWVGTGKVVFGDGSIDESSPCWFGFSSSASAATNKAAIDCAVTSLGTDKGGKIKFPVGSFAVASGIAPGKKNIHFEGAGTGYGYEGSTPGTRLIFTAGTYGFDFTETAAKYCKIKNIGISGNQVLNYGIGIKGCKLIEDTTVSGCTLAGLYVVDYLNSTHINNCNFSYNAGWGVKIAGVYSTTGSFVGMNVRGNTLGGVRIEGGRNISFENSVWEANTGVGLSIYRHGDAGISMLKFTNIWLENNSVDTSGYQVEILEETPSVTAGMGNSVFEHCKIAMAGTQRGVNITGCYHLKFKNVNVLGGAADTNAFDLGAGANFVEFEDLVNYGPTDASLATGNRCWKIKSDPSGSAGGPTITGKLTVTKSLGATGSRVLKGWFADVESTNVPTVNGTTMPLKTDKLSVFAATTSAELAGVISDETGTGALVFGTSPTLVTPSFTTKASGDFFQGLSFGNYGYSNAVMNITVQGAYSLYFKFGNVTKSVMTANGFLSLGTAAVPTAVLHLAAGTATASTAPLKFTSGTLLTAPEAGVIEFLTDAYYGTITTGTVRKAFMLGRTAALTSAATIAVNWNNASVYTLTPAENATLNAEGGQSGNMYSIVITTSGTTAYTLTFGTAFKTVGTLATGTTTAKVFTINFVYDGTNFNEMSRTTAM